MINRKLNTRYFISKINRVCLRILYFYGIENIENNTRYIFLGYP